MNPEPPAKLGILLACAPDRPAFVAGLELAETSLAQGTLVFLYCLDEGVRGLDHPTLQTLLPRGLRLFACAYAAQKRQLPTTGPALFCGLATLNDLIVGTDRFVSFT